MIKTFLTIIVVFLATIFQNSSDSFRGFQMSPNYSPTSDINVESVKPTPTPRLTEGAFREKYEYAIQQRSLTALVALMSELQGKVDLESVMALVEVCTAFNSYDFGDGRQYLIARECSKGVLERRIKLPVRTHFKLIENLKGVEEYRSGLVSQAEWDDDRKRRVEFIFELWERLKAELDPSFDSSEPRNMPIGNVPVPGPYMPGINPDAIKEPEIRAAYIEARVRNLRKAEKYNAQIELKRLATKLPFFAERSLINFYSLEPFNLNELESLVQKFRFDSSVRQRIVETVRRSDSRLKDKN